MIILSCRARSASVSVDPKIKRLNVVHGNPDLTILYVTKSSVLINNFPENRYIEIFDKTISRYNEQISAPWHFVKSKYLYTFG